MAKPKPKFRKPRAPSASLPAVLVNDVAAAISFEIGRCAARANEQAAQLQSIGDQALDLVGEIMRGDGPRELFQRSSAIRGLVTHALTVLSSLQCEAGRLDVIASLRDAEALGDVDSIGLFNASATRHSRLD
jgi:hypothetical protein